MVFMKFPRFRSMHPEIVVTKVLGSKQLWADCMGRQSLGFFVCLEGASLQLVHSTLGLDILPP